MSVVLNSVPEACAFRPCRPLQNFFLAARARGGVWCNAHRLSVHMAEPCPICEALPPHRAHLLPACGHIMCDTCAARCLWDCAICPVCRTACTDAEPAWSIRVEPPASYAALMVTVKHRGVSFAVDLCSDAHECPYERLGHMWDIPPGRLKIVHRGKLLPPMGEDVEAALRPGISLQIIGTRHERQLKEPSRCRRALDAMREALHPLVHSLATLTAPSWLTVRRMPAAVLRAVGVFFRAILPIPPSLHARDLEAPERDRGTV